MTTNMRALVEAMQSVAPDPAVRLRQGVIVSLQGNTATVKIGGSDTEVAGISWASHTCPVPGATCWLATDGRDWMILATLSPSGPAWGTMRKSTAQAIPDSTFTQLDWADRVDVTTYGLTAGNTGFTVVVPGVYSVSASPSMVANATGNRVARILVNGAVVSQGLTIGATAVQARLANATVVKCAATDVINVDVWQSSGGALNTSTGAGHCVLTATWMGPAA
jgi:hypothetical protein